MGRPKGVKNKSKTSTATIASKPQPTNVAASLNGRMEVVMRPTPRTPVDGARELRRLPVALSDPRRSVLEADLVRVTCERTEKDAELAALKVEIRGLAKSEASIAEVLRDGEEEQDVWCRERMTVETNTVDLVRLDTGEVVDTRAATSEDRQLDWTAQLDEVNPS